MRRMNPERIAHGGSDQNQIATQITTEIATDVRHPFRADWAMLYVAGYGNMMKVGISNAPLRRMATLQTAAPEKLTLFYLAALPTRADARKLETRIHSRLSERRMGISFRHVDGEEEYEGPSP